MIKLSFVIRAQILLAVAFLGFNYALIPKMLSVGYVLVSCALCYILIVLLNGLIYDFYKSSPFKIIKIGLV